MGNTFFGSNSKQTPDDIACALKDTSYQHSWAVIENKISYYATFNPPEKEIQSLQAENDARLVRQIKLLSKFNEETWQMLTENDHITISGSYPFAIAHDLLKEKPWVSADIDIFVSLSFEMKRFGKESLDTSVKKIQRGKDISLLIWKSLGIQDKDVEEFKERKERKEIIFSINSDPQYANGDLKREFVCSSKAQHPITRRSINIIVLDLKDAYTNIQDALQKTFDFKVLATCVNDNSIFIPNRQDLLAKRSKFQAGIRAAQRKAKYTLRGIKIVS